MMGIVNLFFELISYHFSTTTIVTEQWIPIFFAVAMATNAITSTRRRKSLPGLDNEWTTSIGPLERFGGLIVVVDKSLDTGA